MNKELSFKKRPQTPTEMKQSTEANGKPETELDAFVMKILRSKKCLDIETEIYEKMTEYLSLSSKMIEKKDYKISYSILKRVETICFHTLSKLAQERLDFSEIYEKLKSFPLVEILQDLKDPSKDLQKFDITILKDYKPNNYDLIKNEFRESRLHFFIEKIVRYLLIALNNSGNILTIKQDPIRALFSWQKAINIRLKVLSSNISIYHLSVLSLNLASAYEKREETALTLESINFALKNLAFLRNLSSKNEEFVESAWEKPSDFLCFLELIEKAADITPPKSNEKPVERFLNLSKLAHILSWESLAKDKSERSRNELEKSKKEFNFIIEEIKSYQVGKKQILSSPPSNKNFKQSKVNFENDPEIKGAEKKSSNTAVDNFNDRLSSASMKSFNTMTSASSAILSKDNIIFKKYVNLNGIKHKIIMLQIADLNCVQILLYCKPREFLRKVFISFQEVINFAKETNESALSNESDLNFLLKKLAQKLYIKDGELHIKDMEYTHTLDEYIRLNPFRKV